MMGGGSKTKTLYTYVSSGKYMKTRGISTFLENFIKKETIFLNKKVLQSSYNPDTIIHRDSEINQIAKILAPSLKGEKPSNLFIYGRTGTGKTLSVQYVLNEINKIALREKTNLKAIYVNCKLKKVADTEYRLIVQLASHLNRTIPPTGLPTDEVYKIFFEAIEQANGIIVLVLDEIDQLVKKTGDEILYTLTRINSELKKSQISIIGISNDLVFTDHLDPRVRSSLNEEEIAFPPYNALQIQDILRRRAEIAFRSNTIRPGVIEKCAAYAAREHGDARRALDLLRVAGELAERQELKHVEIDHIDKAEAKIERDRITTVVLSQPKQVQAILYSLLTTITDKKQIFTGNAYAVYEKLCESVNLRPLTQRRVSDVIAELDMLGIITTRVISKGRHGRTREISLAIPSTTNPDLKHLLEKALELNVR